MAVPTYLPLSTLVPGCLSAELHAAFVADPVESKPVKTQHVLDMEDSEVDIDSAAVKGTP